MNKLFYAGLVIFFLGFILIFAGSLTYSQANTSVGGFVLIGPIPIVFGSGQSGPLLSVLSVIAGLVMIIFVYLYVRSIARRRETNK